MPRGTKQVTGSIKSQLRLMTDRRIILAVIVMITLMAAEYTFYTYIRPIITDVLGFSTSQLNKKISHQYRRLILLRNQVILTLYKWN